MRKQKLPADINQKAKNILDLVTRENKEVEHTKNPAAVALGRLGGLKGGRARAEALSPKKRSEIAKKAANARWDKKKE